MVQCDVIIKEALTAYWSKSKDDHNREGHWIRRSQDIKIYMASKTVDSLVNKKRAMPIMMDK